MARPFYRLVIDWCKMFRDSGGVRDYMRNMMRYVETMALLSIREGEEKLTWTSDLADLESTKTSKWESS